MIKKYKRLTQAFSLIWITCPLVFATCVSEEDYSKETSSSNNLSSLIPSANRCETPPALRDIRRFKHYIRHKPLEINPYNYKTILEYARRNKKAFRAYEDRVVVKNWNPSLGSNALADLLSSFKDIKGFQMEVPWDLDGDVSNLINEAIKSYKALKELNLINCRLTNESLLTILNSIPNPDSLHSLISDNSLSLITIVKIKAIFKNLNNLKFNDSQLSLKDNSLSSLKDYLTMCEFYEVGIQAKDYH